LRDQHSAVPTLLHKPVADEQRILRQQHPSATVTTQQKTKTASQQKNSGSSSGNRINVITNVVVSEALAPYLPRHHASQG